MTVPWPQPFEDGNVKEFLEELEGVAEIVGVKTDRGNLVIQRTLSKGRAKAVLGVAVRDPAKIEWTTAKDALITGFEITFDRQAR